MGWETIGGKAPESGETRSDSALGSVMGSRCLHFQKPILTVKRIESLSLTSSFRAMKFFL